MIIRFLILLLNLFYIYGYREFTVNYTYVGFSPLFVQQLNSYYKSFCDSIGVDSSLYPLNIVSIDTNIDGWYFSYSVMVFYERMQDSSYVVYAPYISLISRTAFEQSYSGNLSSFWSNLLNSIDIASLTSWLPSAISNQFIVYFSSFFALAGVLIVIKIIHG